MADDFLRRWSRLKHRASAEKPAEKPAVVEKNDAPLPPVESLTPESDFTAFMQPKIEDALRRAALKKLFGDPHFNIPDPFEPFSGDWTVGEPIPPEMLATLNQARTHLFSDQEKKEEEGGEKATEAAKAEATVEAKVEAKIEEPAKNEPRRQDA